VSLINKDFKFSEGKVLAAGKIIPTSEYLKHLNEIVIPYSTSHGYKFKDDVYMVGALPRINQNMKALHKDTKKDVNLKKFPSFNVFHNNLAQAIEILHCVDKAIETLESQDFKKEDVAKVEKNNGEGVGIVEAPRGVLYHYVKIKSGNVIKSKVIVPTSQNQIKMEQDIGLMVEALLGKKTKEEIIWDIEQLIRAYDPCMSCATHFLKVKWI
jgi:coenzyme F420-reducing hydrogenase alpha subunit